MSASNKPVDPRVEVVARALCAKSGGDPNCRIDCQHFDDEAITAIRALDEYEARKK